ncbi:efflux RND transporter periplasmic adaptor subunit [Glaciecola sp. KUL10]|jgi:RND family efflux transporter MFP subunit|uniref:efflux RND transporter periplasmic adaptor subunit n=1 Tax=Glaciecola sp. (strain KUL10) TaxID=2161813 RepID=UPI000D78BF2C|nr:efflux RND transporter periplasmic adaptor subunit [Glaciecola sp. KUL10]GBL05776.1 RND family efflux system membrane fusion protein [Glaciecola sp. KUL10]
MLLNKKHGLAAFVLLVCSSSVWAQSWGGAERAASVLVQPVVFEYEEAKIEAVGTAEAVKSVTLFPAVADKVTEINFTPGQRVNAGDVLIKLDDRRQRVALSRAQIQLADAKRNYQRLLDSQKRGAASQSALDDAKTVRDLAEVELEQAQADLEDRSLLAPFDGVLGLTDIEVGDRITTQTVVTTIDKRDNIFVNFNAPEAALGILLNNPEVSLQPWSNRTTYLNAKIAEVDSRIDENDRTIRARAILDNADDNYRPGMSFRVSLSLKGKEYAAIPEAALSWGASGAYVWKSVDDKAQRVDVKVKQRLRGRILVEGKLNQGDTLITEGIQRLRVGQAVKAVPTAVADKPRTEPAKRGES